MARIRTVKPQLRTSEIVASWPREVRYFFVLLWGYLDDEGRGLDVPKGIAGDCFPRDEDVTTAKVDRWLTLMTKPLDGDDAPLCRYQVTGRRYLHCPNWSRHQKVNRPTPSRIPPCPIHDKPTEPLTEPFSESGSEALNGNSVQEVGGRSEEVGGRNGSLRSPSAQGREPRTEPPIDGEPGTAEQILGAWLSTCAKKPPSRVVNDVGRQVAALLAEGIDRADVAEGLRLWQSRGLNPATLPSVVHQVMNAPAPAGPSNVVALRTDPRPSTTNQRVEAALEAGRRVQAKLDQRAADGLT